jgi:hypothetical protein
MPFPIRNLFGPGNHAFEILAGHHDGRPVTGEDVLRMGKVVPQALQSLDRLFRLPPGRGSRYVANVLIAGNNLPVVGKLEAVNEFQVVVASSARFQEGCGLLEAAFGNVLFPTESPSGRMPPPSSQTDSCGARHARQSHRTPSASLGFWSR